MFPSASTSLPPYGLPSCDECVFVGWNFPEWKNSVGQPWHGHQRNSSHTVIVGAEMLGRRESAELTRRLEPQHDCFHPASKGRKPLLLPYQLSFRDVRLFS